MNEMMVLRTRMTKLPAASDMLAEEKELTFLHTRFGRQSRRSHTWGSG